MLYRGQLGSNQGYTNTTIRLNPLIDEPVTVYFSTTGTVQYLTFSNNSVNISSEDENVCYAVNGSVGYPPGGTTTIGAKPNNSSGGKNVGQTTMTLLDVRMDTVYAGRDFDIYLWPTNQQGHLTLKTSDGLIAPIPPAHYFWNVSLGHLQNSTSEKPTYVPSYQSVPDTMREITLTLDALIDGSHHFLKERTLEVYRDHLERDYQNFGAGNECGAPTAYIYYWPFSRYGSNWHLLHSWNCFGSVWHAYDGTHDGYTTTIPTSGFTVTTYDDPIPWNIAVTNLHRGDIVSFYTYNTNDNTEVMQHAHTCIGNASQMYGANNEPVYGRYVRTDSYGHHASYWEGGSWKWWVTSSETYYNQVNADYHALHPTANKLLNRIKVYRRQ